MKKLFAFSGILLPALMLASCGNPQLDASVTSAASGSGTIAQKEPTEARLTVPESQLKFNNLFYGEPLRMETDKTKCRNNTTDAICKQPFKLYHIGDVGDAHMPLLQILIVDPASIKDPALKTFVGALSDNIDGKKADLSAADDVFAKFTDEKVVALLKTSQSEKDGVHYANYYTVNEKNKIQYLYYISAKKVGDQIVMIRLNAGVNQDTKKDSFNAYKDCGATCTAEQKATSYITKKEGFAAYPALLEKVNSMLVSFESK